MGAAEVLAAETVQNSLTIALAGNPNAGKTSIFNNLTGARQHVGNWPGVTVEKKEGQLVYRGKMHSVIDLPGTYSLGAYSEDEIIARDYVLNENPDVIINVVDASNIERNLYLTVQLMETGADVVVALNIMDEARAKGININVPKLAQLLGVPVLPTVATKKEGMQELIAAALQLAGQGGDKGSGLNMINYGPVLEKELAKLEAVIANHAGLTAAYPARWLALKLLEADQHILNQVQKQAGSEAILEQCQKSETTILEATGEDAESLIIDARYGFVSGLAKQTVTRRAGMENRLSRSDQIDKIVTSRVLGFPIFLFAMWGIFTLTFSIGDPLAGYLEGFFVWLGEIAASALLAVNASELIASFVADGVIGGVGAVMVFLPHIMILFFAISILENSGYLARAAYIMDRFMHALGLHGKSFIPLLIGFGCNVPAIMATRTLENKRDKMITILIAPLMSCGGRLPIYVLFVGAFFSAYQGLIIFSLYLLGIVLAVLMGRIFKTFLFPGESAPFVMELPPYRIPTAKAVFIQMWDRVSAFLKRAGTIIFSVVVLIWILAVLPLGVEYGSQASLVGRLGAFIAPVFAPVGFGTWEAGASLFFGILAKEVVVGTLGVIYGVGEEGLMVAIQQLWTPLSAYAFMVMTLLYIPCAAVIGTVKSETGSWKWTGFAVGYTLVLGWVMAFIIYQGGRLLGIS